MTEANSKPPRTCTQCSADISARHYHATLCLDCLKSWGARTGSLKASAAVNLAVRRGELPHARACVCIDCGAPATEYDHRDYNKPLDVEPVCRPCNRKRGPAIPMREAA